MLDFQTQINNMLAVDRARKMKNSPQLTLGELILKFEAIKNKDLPVFIHDLDHRPTGFGSWRGAYCELAIQYEGSSEFQEPMAESCIKDDFGDHHYECKCERSSTSTQLKNPTGQQFLGMLNLIKGKIFTGYKGGDFLMGKSTPMWIANYGDSSGFLENKEGEYLSQGVVDVKENENEIIIVTSLIIH